MEPRLSRGPTSDQQGPSGAAARGDLCMPRLSSSSTCSLVLPSALFLAVCPPGFSRFCAGSVSTLPLLSIPFFSSLLLASG